ncbi:MAG: NADH-quinone oxidoreductase subunit J [Phototrophicaceae bacterium]|jgi:NADH:ubiquinone oxidoreductase subunit 6 (subunit J)
MIETVLFIIFGAVAIAAAVLMLLSETPVHSALFLIVNFACVAFFYLMLEAPFLAMVQIAVYAGAIMVLFLFVIMLLGTERADKGPSAMLAKPGTRYQPVVALGLAAILLGTVAVAALNVDWDNVTDGGGQPRVRVGMFVNTGREVELVIGETVLAESAAYGSATEYVALPAGEYLLHGIDRETGDHVFETSLTLTQGSVQTAVVYGVGEDQTPAFALVDDLPGATSSGTGRLTVFNAYGEAVALQDVGIVQRDGDLQVLIPSIAAGAASEPLELPAGIADSLRLVREGQAAVERDADPLFNIRSLEVSQNTNLLAVLTQQPGATFADLRVVSAETEFSFGSPQAVGQLLFTGYLLPFEVVSLLLLAALVGVIVIAQGQLAHVDVYHRSAQRIARRRVSRPLSSVIATQVQSDPTEPPQLPAGD